MLWDPANQHAWATEYANYYAAGRQTIQADYNHEGTFTYTWWDTLNQANWGVRYEGYDALSRHTSRTDYNTTARAPSVCGTQRTTRRGRTRR